MTDNKRKHERYDSLNLLTYVCVDTDGKAWTQGMGRTLDISESGLRLETHEPIETKYIVLLSIGIADEVVDLKGKVVYCNRGDENKFEAGILFIHLKPNDLELVKKYIQAFEKQYG